MSTLSFARHRFPPAIIRHAVWFCFRFALSCRDIEDLLAERGIDVSCETVRRCRKRISTSGSSGSVRRSSARAAGTPAAPRPVGVVGDWDALISYAKSVQNVLDGNGDRRLPGMSDVSPGNLRARLGDVSPKDVTHRSVTKTERYYFRYLTEAQRARARASGDNGFS